MYVNIWSTLHIQNSCRGWILSLARRLFCVGFEYCNAKGEWGTNCMKARLAPLSLYSTRGLVVVFCVICVSLIAWLKRRVHCSVFSLLLSCLTTWACVLRVCSERALTPPVSMLLLLWLFCYVPIICRTLLIHHYIARITPSGYFKYRVKSIHSLFRSTSAFNAYEYDTQMCAGTTLFTCCATCLHTYIEHFVYIYTELIAI